MFALYEFKLLTNYSLPSQNCTFNSFAVTALFVQAKITKKTLNGKNFVYACKYQYWFGFPG